MIGFNLTFNEPLKYGQIDPDTDSWDGLGYLY